MFYRMFDRVQILPNTLKHVETCLNSTKQGGQTEKCFAKQQCFSMFYRKTFTVWTGLKPFVKGTTDASGIQFLYKNSMINAIKSFLKVIKNYANSFTLV